MNTLKDINRNSKYKDLFFYQKSWMYLWNMACLPGRRASPAAWPRIHWAPLPGWHWHLCSIASNLCTTQRRPGNSGSTKCPKLKWKSPADEQRSGSATPWSSLHRKEVGGLQQEEGHYHSLRTAWLYFLPAYHHIISPARCVAFRRIYGVSCVLISALCCMPTLTLWLM